MESKGTEPVSNQVADELDELAKKLSDTARLEKAGITAAEILRKHIYEGNGFTPLSRATTDYRGNGRPLLDTGSLRDSITSELKGNDSISVGTTKLYAPIQNNGGTITAKKNWLFIPAKGTRQLERRYGPKPKDVLDGLRNGGYRVFRIGRTVCYRKKDKDSATRVAYYLRKTVTIPARKFWYLSDDEMRQIEREIFPDA
jgi:phage gpG-like protein